MRSLFFLLPTFLMCACCSAMSKDETRMHSIIQKHSVFMKRENKLMLAGSGGSFPDSIHGFTLDYVGYKKLDIEQARILFVRSTQGLLNMINSDEMIRPKLSNFPFTEDNLDFGIAFEDASKDNYVAQPYVAYVTLIKGDIIYAQFDREKDQFCNEYRESYSEALRIVREEGGQ
ncbi:MAG: hypothetical protein K940chlam7_00171 [Chlamydiae bacterium]|nr:hypothetical protein [Chlamydiota bacterium]